MESYWDLKSTWNRNHKITPAWRKIIMEECICICGKIKYFQRQHLLSWASKNCWCKRWIRLSKFAKENAIHWMEWTHPYKKYTLAKARCNHVKNDSYPRYWGRWIKMEWLDFKSFWKDMWKGYNEHVERYWNHETTLDRIDVNGNYCVGNCRWATWAEQNNNRSTNHFIEYLWEKLTISNMAKKYWLSKWLLSDRINKQWWSIKDSIEINKI